MKLSCSLIFFCLFATANAQTTFQVFEKGISYAGENPHLIVNTFAAAMGDELKEHYPARVQKIEMTLIVNNDGQMILTCVGTIAPCDSSQADYHFEHAGSMWASTTVANSLSQTKADCDAQTINRKIKFENTYPSSRIVGQYRPDPVFFHDKYWAICESFITGGRTDNE